MPRGNKDNLISLATRTTEEKRRIGIAGGKASGEARRKRKSIKEQMLLMLEADPTIQERLIEKLFERAYKTGEKTGSAANRAFELIRETIGEAPIEDKKVGIEIEDLKPLASLLTITEEEKKQYESND